MFFLSSSVLCITLVLMNWIGHMTKIIPTWCANIQFYFMFLLLMICTIFSPLIEFTLFYVNTQLSALERSCQKGEIIREILKIGSIFCFWVCVSICFFLLLLFLLSINSHLANAHYQLVLLNTVGDIMWKNVSRKHIHHHSKGICYKLIPSVPSDLCKQRKPSYSIRSRL